MGFKSIFKKGVTSGLNPKKWVSYDQIKGDSSGLVKMVRSVFKRSKSASRKETFEEAVKRLQLTEKDIQKRIQTAKQLVFAFLSLGGLLLAYAVYQWIAIGGFVEGFLCLTLSLLLFAYAFREHFNLFQMRSRRLGCTYAEWFKGTFKKRSK